MLIDVGCAVARYLGRGGLAQPLLLSYALGCVALDVSRALNMCVGYIDRVGGRLGAVGAVVIVVALDPRSWGRTKWGWVVLMSWG